MTETAFDPIEDHVRRELARGAAALYSGWGPNPLARNPGDELCHRAALNLLESQGIGGLTAARGSFRPATYPWSEDLVIGGGTVLPTLFDSRRAPGLKHARRIFVFGSGCLSPGELRLLGVEDIHRHSFNRATVIGVRGPLSAENYSHLFNKRVPFIGDLAFAFADKAKVGETGNEGRKVGFFLIEDELPGSRVSSSLEHVAMLYADLCSVLTEEKSVIHTWWSDAKIPMMGSFDEHRRISSADDFTDA
ncbi:polysaccharide pyruvyl transferase family protein [Streptomyces sp. NPDC048191]|uniref:polysaccharide pyruvyl transferase family protein n=1 Tax=Streptomyces sp. NPDC048191 TaxID=3155484 RepID=UPI0033DFCD24